MLQFTECFSMLKFMFKFTKCFSKNFRKLSDLKYKENNSLKVII